MIHAIAPDNFRSIFCPVARGTRFGALGALRRARHLTRALFCLAGGRFGPGQRETDRSSCRG
jgi:hypothetical protein